MPELQDEEPKRKIVIEPIGGTWEEVLGPKSWDGVRVTVRCAKCGRVVMRTTLGDGDISGHFACRKHGEIAGEITLRHLVEEWTRRGDPESFTIKRNPVR